MASQFAYIVTACKKYIPELCANLNSLDYVGNTFDVHVWGYQLPESFISQFSELNYEVIFHNIEETEAREYGGEGEILCRKRYWYAGEIGKAYDAVCILDADLVWVRNPKQYFEIASKTGFIVGVHKEQNKVYDDPHHQLNSEWLIPKGFYNDKDLCNCPLFIDAKIWEQALKDSWLYFITGYPNTNFKAPDMDAMNIAFLKYGGYDKIIKLSNHSWLGTNETLLKPYTRAVMNRDLIRTENGQEIYSYHGQFYKDKWRQCQLDNRHGCASGYLKATECSDNMAKGAMDCLYEYFKKMLDYKIVIEKRDYV